MSHTTKDDQGRKGTKISNTPASLERVTAVTTSQPSPGGELGAPQALPLLLPLSLCHRELWPSLGGSGPVLGSVCSPWLLCTELSSGFGAAPQGCGSPAPLEQAWKHLGMENR